MKIITILGIKLAGLREILEARVGIEPKTILKAQKLLILLNAKNAKNTESAQAGYTAGTRRVHGSLGYLTPRESAYELRHCRRLRLPAHRNSGNWLKQES